MMRIALGVEYEGTHYHGWQDQGNIPTIQRSLETALSKVANQPVQITCAGRTDRGVHATGQVIHFDTQTVRKPDAWVLGANSYLPPDVSVRWVKIIDENFHARFSAISRHYQYVIYNHAIRPSISRSVVTWHYRELDVERMAEATKYLLGEHDFSSFCATNYQSRTAKRDIRFLTVSRKNNLIVVDIVANSFLQHMVRNIVGVLMEVGEGKRSPYWCKEVLDAKNRTVAGETAPPHGLYLVQVAYPDQFQLPAADVNPFFLHCRR
jgi:tRNA pseudouridine38-40 synthase